MVLGELNAYTKWMLGLKNIDVIYHCAAMNNHTAPNTENIINEYRKVNVDAVSNLAEQAVSAGVKRLIFLSTIKVMGENTLSGCSFTHEEPAAPQEAYAMSKFEAEKVLLGIAKKSSLEVVIIRPPLIYGPEVKGNFASLIRAIDRGLPMPFGAIDNYRSFVGLDNLIDLLIL